MFELPPSSPMSYREAVFAIRTRFDDPAHVVEVSGELDMTGRQAIVHACTAFEQVEVLVDLSDLTFMDCAGYGAIAAARSTLESRGGILLLRNAVGQPRELLTLIDQLERAGDAESLRQSASVALCNGAGRIAGSWFPVS